LQVKIWFQNRRTKWKKQDNISNAEAAEHKNLNSVTKEKTKQKPKVKTDEDLSRISSGSEHESRSLAGHSESSRAAETTPATNGREDDEDEDMDDPSSPSGKLIIDTDM
jgi:hypothetical protein